MKRFKPALAVTRERYSVTSVQLQHPKTQSEREWAKMKSSSWPPWKESKLGINEHVDAEYGISRAGYPEQAWEKTAGVLVPQGRMQRDGGGGKEEKSKNQKLNTIGLELNLYRSFLGFGTQSDFIKLSQR